jgi:hypothetical protein
MGILLYPLFIIAIGALMSAIPCWLVWRLTRKLPISLRLLFAAFMAALIVTPWFHAKIPGFGPFFLLPIDLNRLDPITSGVISVVVWWIALFLFLLVVAVIGHFVPRESPEEKTGNPPAKSDSSDVDTIGSRR